MQPKIYHASDHDIDPSLIDSDALYVLDKLRKAGFLAYLVGGSVRDLLAKKKPKDFDISTSARPEQLKQVFQRQCLLIGKRFRLAHIRFGHKIIEVSTFRSGENDSDLIIHDNAWGSPEEDVLRRDFTINGLFYDPSSHTVIDYVGGWDDIHKKVLRTIGDPMTRFRQDPVRMIRLIKFRARFGFSVDSKTTHALSRCHHEIIKSAPARILEEILRMLESGASEPFFRLMTQTGMLELLFPCLALFLEGPHGNDIYNYLSIIDTINQSNIENSKKPLDRAILTACLIFPMLEREIESKYIKNKVTPNFGQILVLSGAIIHAVVTSSFSHFPRRLSMSVNFILSTQYRLTPLSGKRSSRPALFQNREFDLVIKFLKIRAQINDNLMEDYSWWHHLHIQHEKQEDKRHRHPHPAPHSHHDHLDQDETTHVPS